MRIKFILKALILSMLVLSSYAGSWSQAALQYEQLIAGKKYLAQVSLLRPETYFIENHATNPGKLLTVNLPEMGLDNVAMKVVSIKHYPGIAIKESDAIRYKQIDEIDWANKANRPVTATFARYAEKVYTYKFKNLKTGVVTSINSTPNHPFYVVNKGDYEKISNITADDELLSQTGEKVKLLCDKAHNNCGIRYNKDNKPTLVYNFEVYQEHHYFAGQKSNNLLVHNGCLTPEKTNWLEANTKTTIRRERDPDSGIVNYETSTRPKGYYLNDYIALDTIYKPNNMKYGGKNILEVDLVERAGDTGGVYASDLFTWQNQQLQSKFGVTLSPDIILGNHITNPGTKRALGLLINNKFLSRHMVTPIMKRTPLGKMGVRVANDFGRDIDYFSPYINSYNRAGFMVYLKN
jgi:hypothetical protein